jgi:undecaprenyl-diphosphatase
MSGFDLSVLKALFAFVHWCPWLDPIFRHLVSDDFLKGGVVMAVFWWMWFRDDKPVCEKREFVIYAFVSSSAAIILGRLLALSIPFRVRPLQNPLYDFPFPPTAAGDIPRSWNSFPSDHAILFFCLAAALWMVSRRIGVLALCHALFVVCLPRIYMGYHYPSDIAAGALIGIGMALVGKFARVKKWVVQPAFIWLKRHPASFYAFAFLWTFEVAELFRTLLNLQGLVRQGAASFLQAHL